MPPKPLRVYAIPVSGGLFAVQMGLLCAVSAANAVTRGRGIDVPYNEEKPDIVLASSGGNVTAYAGLSADWMRERIYRVADLLKTNQFLSPWSDSAPSWMFFAVSRAIFREGYGVEGLVRYLFTESALRDAPTEIWTGAYNRRTGQQRLFTNKSCGNTILVPYSSGEVAEKPGELYLGVDVRCIYAGGNIDVIAKASLASASIPWLVKPVEILGDLYSDGGCLYASPLTTVDADLANLGTGANARVLRMVYFSPKNMSEPRESKDSLMAEIDNLLFATFTCDVRAFISLIVRLGAPSPDPSEHHHLNSYGLSELLSDLDATGKSYAVLLFPETSAEENLLNLQDLRPMDMRRVMGRTEEDFGAFVWKTV